MLILGRDTGEVIYITVGDKEIKIINCGERTIRLGFEAPDDIEIMRAELYDGNKDTQEKGSRNRL